MRINRYVHTTSGCMLWKPLRTVLSRHVAHSVDADTPGSTSRERWLIANACWKAMRFAQEGRKRYLNQACKELVAQLGRPILRSWYWRWHLHCVEICSASDVALRPLRPCLRPLLTFHSALILAIQSHVWLTGPLLALLLFTIASICFYRFRLRSIRASLSRLLC